MERPIAGSVAVVTGASSGIGRAAARTFAREGADVVVCGRDEAALHDVVHECELAGARAVAVAADVVDGEQVERVAATAVERFGRIDTWVNNAGVMAYGTFEQIPADVFDHVVATNVIGQANGSRVALARFRLQEAGVLLNVASLWGRVTSPLVSPYVASKHAVRALSECIDRELVDAPGIHVTTVLPAAVDTPIFDNAANYSGKRLRPLWPIFDVQDVAEGIVACARSPKREITYGRAGRGLEVLYAFLPPLYRRIAPGAFMRGTFAHDPVDETPGNVFASGRHEVEGGWRRRRRRDLAAGFLGALIGAFAGLLGRLGQVKP
jgi:short-subunit dehydrogenase